MVDDDKKSIQRQQNEQFARLLKDLGITSRRSILPGNDQKKANDMFSD